jgi:hypothetical protein
MPTQARLVLQVRLVQVIYRSEAARIARRDLPADTREEGLDDLRRRSISVLQNARGQLDGKAIWHADVLRAIGDLEAEIER